MVKIALPEPPAPLTEHEQKIELIKSEPPRPLILYLLVAALTSIGGLIMGWIYLVKDGARNKQFGLLSFLLGLLIPAAVILIIFLGQEEQRQQRAPLPEQPGIRLPQ